MRIITGKARGRNLKTPAGENTRPTAERAKEAIFSMLQFELEDRRVLDLFAGSGQLGLEAVSRGAESAVLVDHAKDAAAVIRENCLKTGLSSSCEVFCMDYTDYLRTCRGRRKFDLVFLDPPYALGLIPKALDLLTRGQILSVGGTVVCESADAEDVFAGDEAAEEKFEVLKKVRYGAAFVTLLRYKGETV